jgi:UDP-N-acetylglucosamine 2-epimerase (non-hydrolysing)
MVPLGTRPEIVKLAPVVTTLLERDIDLDVVATGQHYDPTLSEAFFVDLGVTPTVRWQLDGTESERVAGIFRRAIDLIAERPPDVVLVLGDTNTVPLFCLAARRARAAVAHLEAGLRSFNPTSAEEVNRQVAGALASLHFAPTELAARFLHREGVSPDRVRVVGNPIVDVLRRSGLKPVPVDSREGVVVTAHRASNVDNPERLAELVRIVRGLAEEVGPVTFPVHPRTRQRLDKSGLRPALEVPNVQLLEPVPWVAMLQLLRTSRLVVTDSGGLQEEASYFGVPVVVLRTSTPRWEGVDAGTSVLTGLDSGLALEAARSFVDDATQARVAATPCPYGDGYASERVADILLDPATQDVLALREPDLSEGLSHARSR